MKILKITLALSLMAAPLFAEEVVVDESVELQELMNVMKQDRAVNRERLNRLKKLMKEKGCCKKTIPEENSIAQK